MINKRRSALILSFIARFVFPTVITIALFLTAFFSIIIPAIEKNSIDRKREMIRELTTSAWNIFAKLEQDERRGVLSRKEAQIQAIDQIRNLHYGREMKDYFWINDMHPRMVVHPYRGDLNGKDLSDYTDQEGKKIFIEMVNLVREEGDGYVEYMWQWKDEEKRILPKISYVKGFKPWGWIIGTGIYIDDVKGEIDELTGDLINISIFILAVITMLLGFIANQSYKALREQQEAEAALRESEEKYRTLVESAAEGMFMELDGTFMYVNVTIAEMLECAPEELIGKPIREVFRDGNGESGTGFIDALSAGGDVPERFEAELVTGNRSVKDVAISATRINLGGKVGFMAVVSDITNRKRETDELWASEEKYRTMAGNLNVGFFRMSVEKNPAFIEVNNALAGLLGYDTREDLLPVQVTEFFPERDELLQLQKRMSGGMLRREVVRLRRKDGIVFRASIWGRLSGGKTGPACFDGIMVDITDVVIREDESRMLISEMQSALIFFNRTISGLVQRDFVFGGSELSVSSAVELMENSAAEVMIIKDHNGGYRGIVTDHDLRKALMRSGFKPESAAVAEIMSSPVITIQEQSTAFEAWVLMTGKNISHLPVEGFEGEITGIIDSYSIMSMQNYSPAVLLDRVRNSSSPGDIIEANRIRPYMITTLVESGAKPQNINHLTTVLSDTILQRFIEFAVAELGDPPVPFTFIVFGSEGREEQTLSTDQDNAIIYADVPDGNDVEVNSYFLKLGDLVCGWLDEAGYTFCDGNNMAMNPEYCRPLSVWKEYFSRWVYSATAEDLLRVKIFFDFRTGYGDRNIEKELREHLGEILSVNPRFFHLLARNILPMAPPIGRFGNFVVESTGEHKGSFDIKSSMIPIVDFARIYALKHNIRISNTVMRLDSLHEKGVLTDLNHQEMVQAYTYLMQIRLRVQTEAVVLNRGVPDNYVFPKSLSSIEQRLLKEIFAQTKNFQVRLSYDFTGQMGGV